MDQKLQKRKEQLARIAREKIPESNLRIAKTLIVFAAMCFIAWLLFQFGLLKSKGLFVNAALIVTPILFLISALWCLFKKGKGTAHQSVFLIELAVFWLELELMSGYKSKLLLPILIVLSLQYYNRKFTLYTFFVCLFSLLLSVICNAYLYDVTGFIDLNLVSFSTSQKTTFEGFIVNNIILLRPDSAVLLKNGLLLTFLPNTLFLSVTVILTIRFMRMNLSNMLSAEDYAAREADQRLALSDMKTKVMLSQIKPHFIYNTLTTVSYFCSTDPEKAEELTNRFSDYLRSNLSSLSMSETVDFSKELEAVKNYLEIEKMRFEERIRVVYDIHADSFPVPVLSIQPIVENAVKHGICKKEEGGTVKISSFEEANAYRITVEDDGVGFDRTEETFDGVEHVGVKNIISRIESFGGTIAIQSQVGVGTTVTVTLPKEGKLC